MIIQILAQTREILDNDELYTSLRKSIMAQNSQEERKPYKNRQKINKLQQFCSKCLL